MHCAFLVQSCFLTLSSGKKHIDIDSHESVRIYLCYFISARDRGSQGQQISVVPKTDIFICIAEVHYVFVRQARVEKHNQINILRLAVFVCLLYSVCWTEGQFIMASALESFVNRILALTFGKDKICIMDYRSPRDSGWPGLRSNELQSIRRKSNSAQKKPGHFGTGKEVDTAQKNKLLSLD